MPVKDGKKQSSPPPAVPRKEKEPLTVTAARKRDREPSPVFSLEDEEEGHEDGVGRGRISPLPPPPAARIPKLRKTDSEQGSERQRKRSGEAASLVSTPPPDKRPKPIQIE